MTIRSRPRVALALLTLLLAGCGGGGSVAREQACRPDSQSLPRGQGLTVAEALETAPSGLISVRGAFLYREGGRPRFCTSLAESYPPQCGEPSLVIEGLGNPYRAIEGLQVTGQGGLQPATPRVAWSESITAGGRLDGGVLRIEGSCSSKRVIDLFRTETGQELALDLFLSSSELEHLNFEALESIPTARKRRREWGAFTIVVFLRQKERALQRAFEQVSDAAGVAAPVIPDDRGIVWHRRGEDWIALKEYGQGVVLEWFAGPRKTTNRRFARLDGILSGV